MAPRTLNIEKFAPKITNQDKRDRNNAVLFLNKQVQKNCNVLGFGSIAAAPVVNIQREIIAYQYFAPKGSPLEKWLNKPDVKNGFEAACMETQVWIYDKEEKRQNNDNEPEDEQTEQKENKLSEPPLPIFAMNTKELERFFPLFMESLYLIEDTKCVRKWAKKDPNTGIILAEPTPLQIYDRYAEQILPRNEYFGPGKPFKLGNVTWRIKLLISYIMKSRNVDYNNYCIQKPSEYVDKTFSLEDLKNISNNPNIESEKSETIKKVRFGQCGFKNLNKKNSSEKTENEEITKAKNKRSEEIHDNSNDEITKAKNTRSEEILDDSRKSTKERSEEIHDDSNEEINDKITNAKNARSEEIHDDSRKSTKQRKRLEKEKSQKRKLKKISKNSKRRISLSSSSDSSSDSDSSSEELPSEDEEENVVVEGSPNRQSSPTRNNNSLNSSLNDTFDVTATPTTEDNSANEIDLNEYEANLALISKAANFIKSNTIGIKDIHEKKTTEPINVQIIDLNLFDKMAGSAPCWRADLHDGRHLSKNVLFDISINQRVIEELSFKEKFPIVKLLKFEIIKESLILVTDFKVEMISEQKVEFYNVDELSLTFFKQLRGGQPGTPSRMRGDIFKRKRDTLATSLARREVSKRRKLIQ